MHYFFDESGNWQEPQQEKNRLVIAGLLIQDEAIQKEMEQEFSLFKARHGLSVIHANEMSSEIKEELYALAYTYFSKKEIKIMAHYFDSNVLYSQTQKDPDELYIEIASRLICDMSFGDHWIDIEYDMKFHYAYATNILQNIKTPKREEYAQIQKAFELTELGREKNTNRLKDVFSRDLNKRHNKALQGAYNKLCSSDVDIQKKFLSDYLWSEFRLKVEKTHFLKERFKEKITELNRQQCKAFGLPFELEELKINYKHKHQQSIGVQMIDVASNLVWRYGNSLPKNLSTATKNIYSTIILKDISDEI